MGKNLYTIRLFKQAIKRRTRGNYRITLLKIGLRLQEVQRECCYDTETVAALLGISIEEYERYEKDEKEPTVAVLEKMEGNFNISRTYIQSGHRDMFTNVTGGAIINGKLIPNPNTVPKHKRQYTIPRIVKTGDMIHSEMVTVDKSLMDEVYNLQERVQKLEEAIS